MLFSAMILSAPGLCPAEKTEQKTLAGVEFMTGFGWSDLHGQSGYNMVPLSVAFDFDLKGLTRKINFDPPQLLQFQVEPFAGAITSPRGNLETGLILWVKMGFFPETWKFQPYIKIGPGIDYMTLHTGEQGTQFNFITHGALGAHYYFTPNTAFIVEGRWRHLSNAGIKEPNHGFNSYFVLTGIAYKY